MLESAMLKIEYDKPLAALTTFHLRANAEAWVEVASLEDIRDALSIAKGRGWQTTILGGGSNVVPMPLVPGLVIHPVFRGIHEAQSESGSLVVVVGAAEALDDLVRYTVGKDWADSKISQPFQALSAVRSSKMPAPTALKWPKESPGCAFMIRISMISGP